MVVEFENLQDIPFETYLMRLGQYMISTLPFLQNL